MLGAFHPFFLHFAVGLLLTAPLCDVFGLLLRREGMLHAGRWTTLFGTFACVLAVVSGLGAESSLGAHSPAGGALLDLHKALGFVLLAVWLPIAVWRWGSKMPLPLRLRTIYLAAAFAAAVVVTVETALGTTLVYGHGVGLSATARAQPLARPPPSEKR